MLEYLTPSKKQTRNTTDKMTLLDPMMKQVDTDSFELLPGENIMDTMPHPMEPTQQEGKNTTASSVEHLTKQEHGYRISNKSEGNQKERNKSTWMVKNNRNGQNPGNIQKGTKICKIYSKGLVSYV